MNGTDDVYTRSERVLANVCVYMHNNLIALLANCTQKAAARGRDVREPRICYLCSIQRCFIAFLGGAIWTNTRVYLARTTQNVKPHIIANGMVNSCGLRAQFVRTKAHTRPFERLVQSRISEFSRTYFCVAWRGKIHFSDTVCWHQRSTRSL